MRLMITRLEHVRPAAMLGGGDPALVIATATDNHDWHLQFPVPKTTCVGDRIEVDVQFVPRSRTPQVPA